MGEHKYSNDHIVDYRFFIRKHIHHRTFDARRNHILLNQFLTYTLNAITIIWKVDRNL